MNTRNALEKCKLYCKVTELTPFLHELLFIYQQHQSLMGKKSDLKKIKIIRRDVQFLKKHIHENE